MAFLLEITQPSCIWITETALVPVYPQLFPGQKPVWQERAAAKDAKGIASVIMVETAKAVIICFFMVKPPVILLCLGMDP